MAGFHGSDAADTDSVILAKAGIHRPRPNTDTHRGGREAATEGRRMNELRINLLFGFLGSGKTTLVRRILGERSAVSVEPRRSAAR